MTDCGKFTFPSTVDGFHVYRHTWTPHIEQQLQAQREEVITQGIHVHVDLHLQWLHQFLVSELHLHTMDSAQLHVYVWRCVPIITSVVVADILLPSRPIHHVHVTFMSIIICGYSSRAALLFAQALLVVTIQGQLLFGMQLRCVREIHTVLSAQIMLYCHLRTYTHTHVYTRTQKQILKATAYTVVCLIFVHLISVF